MIRGHTRPAVTDSDDEADAGINLPGMVLDLDRHTLSLFQLRV
jgi:hypothetical protein